MSRLPSKSIEMSSEPELDYVDEFHMSKLIEINSLNQSIVTWLKKIYHIVSFMHIEVGKLWCCPNDVLRNILHHCCQNDEVYQAKLFMINSNETFHDGFKWIWSKLWASKCNNMLIWLKFTSSWPRHNSNDSYGITDFVIVFGISNCLWSTPIFDIFLICIFDTDFDAIKAPKI